ncbi:hypothetical protein LSTR_LSTR004717 [Laodelphax striatellus]|uniref:Uncharacterized protein n=1 Tax=Laodelphax striatellus TaxID=195883 RepID=A0A482WTU9_LAOST|nr:hypothetical protein LSTR_LSTR004717 [Laodelphax striatellus]
MVLVAPERASACESATGDWWRGPLHRAILTAARLSSVVGGQTGLWRRRLSALLCCQPATQFSQCRAVPPCSLSVRSRLSAGPGRSFALVPMLCSTSPVVVLLVVAIDLRDFKSTSLCD